MAAPFPPGIYKIRAIVGGEIPTPLYVTYKGVDNVVTLDIVNSSDAQKWHIIPGPNGGSYVVVPVGNDSTFLRVSELINGAGVRASSNADYPGLWAFMPIGPGSADTLIQAFVQDEGAVPLFTWTSNDLVPGSQVSVYPNVNKLGQVFVLEGAA